MIGDHMKIGNASRPTQRPGFGAAAAGSDPWARVRGERTGWYTYLKTFYEDPFRVPMVSTTRWFCQTWVMPNVPGRAAGFPSGLIGCKGNASQLMRAAGSPQRDTLDRRDRQG